MSNSTAINDAEWVLKGYFNYGKLLQMDSTISTVANCWLQEQALYEKEGLCVKRIDYIDNQDCIGGCPAPA